MQSLAKRCDEKEHQYQWYKDTDSTSPSYLSRCCYARAKHVWISHRVSDKTLLDRRFRIYFQAVKRGVSGVPVQPIGLEDRFHRLVCRWREETKSVSSTTDRILHPAYQDIIGMGKAAVPLILREMETHGGHWFWALRHITEENPVSHEDAGQIPEMTEAWLRWGREHRYL